MIYACVNRECRNQSYLHVTQRDDHVTVLKRNGTQKFIKVNSRLSTVYLTCLGCRGHNSTYPSSTLIRTKLVAVDLMCAGCAKTMEEVVSDRIVTGEFYFVGESLPRLSKTLFM